jgi:hypothetical protein
VDHVAEGRGLDGDGMRAKLHEPARDLFESGLGDIEGDTESLLGQFVIDLGWVVGSFADIAGLIGIEFDFDEHFWATAKHAEAMKEVGLGIPVFWGEKRPTGIEEGADTAGVKVSDGLGEVIEADGIPFAEIVMKDEHIDIAVGQPIFALGEVGQVEGMSIGDRLGELLEGGGRGFECGFGGNIDGRLESFDIDDDLLREKGGQFGEGLTGELDFGRGESAMEGPFSDEEADQFSGAKTNFREGPMGVSQVKSILDPIESDGGTVLVLEYFEQPLDGPFVTPHDPGEMGLGRVGSGPQLLEEPFVELDRLEASPRGFRRWGRRHGRPILRESCGRGEGPGGR